MSKSSSSNDDSDAKKNTAKNVLFSSLLFNLERNERNFDATSSSSSTTPFHRHAGGELARIIRARSTRFLTHASPTVAAVEENVASAIALARGDALTKTLEVHALMDADGRHVGRSLARVNEDAFFGVESEALAKTKRDVEALVEAKENEREKEEEKREKETKERRRKELKEAMMFRKEEE